MRGSRTFRVKINSFMGNQIPGNMEENGPDYRCDNGIADAHFSWIPDLTLMFTSLFHSNGFRPDAVCRVQRQKSALFGSPEKFDRIRSDMSGDRA